MEKRTYQDRKEYHTQRRNRAMALLREIKFKGECAGCGYKTHPEILQFHHRDPSKKAFKMSKGSIGCFSDKKILSEVAKCDLMCPNCHFWLHFQEYKIFAG